MFPSSIEPPTRTRGPRTPRRPTQLERWKAKAISEDQMRQLAVETERKKEEKRQRNEEKRLRKGQTQREEAEDDGDTHHPSRGTDRSRATSATQSDISYRADAASTPRAAFRAAQELAPPRRSHTSSAATQAALDWRAFKEKTAAPPSKDLTAVVLPGHPRNSPRPLASSSALSDRPCRQQTPRPWREVSSARPGNTSSQLSAASRRKMDEDLELSRLQLPPCWKTRSTLSKLLFPVDAASVEQVPILTGFISCSQP